MRILVYILAFSFSYISCSKNTNNQNASDPVTLTTTTTAEKPKETGDSIYKLDGYLFEAKKNASFEFVARGQQPKLNTKGDTLYWDEQTVVLGDIEEVVSPGIFIKFAFKSKFDNFKVDKIYKGKLAPPNFATDPVAKHFVTKIKRSCKEGVNFAGHYTIVEWGCGALCQHMAIIDRISGKIIYSQIPFDTLDGHSGIDFRIDSRMLIVNTEALSEFYGYEPGYRLFSSWRKPAVYEIKNGRIELVE